LAATDLGNTWTIATTRACLARINDFKSNGLIWALSHYWTTTIGIQKRKINWPFHLIWQWAGAVAALALFSISA